MADPNPVSAPKPPKIERVKSGAAILGAIAGAVTGLWGVYEKVRTEAKDLTAASYNTLAPQMNQIGEALKELQQENQHLREILAQQSGKPRIAAEPPASPTRRVRPGAQRPVPPPSQPRPPPRPRPPGHPPPRHRPHPRPSRRRHRPPRNNQRPHRPRPRPRRPRRIRSPVC